MVRVNAEESEFIGPIVAPQAADVLAAELRRKVLDGRLVEGDVLPAERALMADTRLGRATVREALRILEVEELITPRVGRYGGWTVRRPDRTVVSRSIDGFIRGTGIRFADLLTTREAIEPSCAALAAENRSNDDLAILEQLNERLARSVRQRAEFLRINVEWHVAVVDATHNELLIAIMAALADAIHRDTEVDQFASVAVRRAAVKAHAAVVTAIRGQDADAASRRMHRHVHAFREQVTRYRTSRS